MLPTGHEGPYSIEALMKRKTSAETKIWAEGLTQALPFKVVLEKSYGPPVSIHPEPPSEPEQDELPPPLPPLPLEDGPPADAAAITPEVAVSSGKKIAVVVVATLLLVGFGIREWVKSKEHFSIKRASRMSPELFEKINQDFKFEGWNKRIFFKEYVPADMSHLWLVTSSYQNCKIEANFNSLNGKLLSPEEEKVSFKSTTQLSHHIAEFSQFEFSSGSKIIPGLYEMDLKATDCTWDGVTSRLANWFKAPDETYVTRMKVVLYHKGSVEFNTILDKLIRKKMELEIKNQNQEDLFWQDLQQKLQTLLAVSLQIEQLFLDFTETIPKNHPASLKHLVDKYTSNYGRFLTEFVVQNEKYFLELGQSELSNLSQKRTYETMVRLTSKNIGFESMKIIEELQAKKRPSKKEFNEINEKVRKKFELLKDVINRKIIQLTEDRVK